MPFRISTLILRSNIFLSSILIWAPPLFFVFQAFPYFYFIPEPLLGNPFHLPPLVVLFIRTSKLSNWNFVRSRFPTTRNCYMRLMILSEALYVAFMYLLHEISFSACRFIETYYKLPRHPIYLLLHGVIPSIAF